MARPDLWSQIKGTIAFATSATSPRRLRLTDQREPGGESDRWRPWDAVSVDTQHISAAVYIAFGGTLASATLATGVADYTGSPIRQQWRTRILYAARATSISVITPPAATTVYIDLYKY